MKITILTLFPQMVSPYLEMSIMERAQRANAVDFTVLDIRDFSSQRANAVDDTPYGGGAGMVMQVQPIYSAVEYARTLAKTQAYVVLLSAKGERYTQSTAHILTQKKHLIFICGRYEGVDERVAQHVADVEMSIGDFVLTGGELGALTIVDSVVRLLPDVLGSQESLMDESHSQVGMHAAPQYTKPASYNGWDVPEVLLSGHHAQIEEWREDHRGYADKKE